MIKLVYCKNEKEVAVKSAEMVKDVVKADPWAVLGLATGSSPLGAYAYLADKCKEGLDFSRVTSVNLDEYVGLNGENDQSYRYFMNKNLFSKINIDITKTFVPNGCASDLCSEGEAYDKMIEDLGGIDIQLLGIGLDGHIGFNEPEDFFTKETHLVSLDESTIEANSRFFASRDEVPKQAITMGMYSIMQARKVLLIANGKAKKDIIEKAFFGKITPWVPASILQLHNDVTVIYSEN
jgi:glucosamine-6-phosphate deaminase